MSSSLAASDYKTVTSADGTKVAAWHYKSSLASAKTLVLVHGWTVSSDIFDPLLLHDSKLLQLVNVITYDLRGHGRTSELALSASDSDATPAQGAIDSQTIAQDHKAVLEAFGVKEHTFVGWSLGASVSIDVALHFPSLLKKVIWLAPLPWVGSIQRAVIPAYLGSLFPGLLVQDSVSLHHQTALKLIDIFSIRGKSLQWSEKSRLVGNLSFCLPEARTAWATRMQDPEAFKNALKEGSATLDVLIGKEDQLVDSTILERELTREFGEKTFGFEVIDDAGHHLAFDQEEKTSEWLIRHA
ncbi:alpha/beta-hydrolase [Ceraceosorus guamensis]|uniref:Alpha/beta-hydrolase n=1 Tax=Ceraceosorus guamensis TaxID=1522189 RepID=A0A316VT84_9BASI|nr:alpha/beta-hydrolase [Ceraceosorus guamensis]PWN40434.1 alpha/beta-hydrolase [Ceraceosorus guamensis]